MDKTESVIHFHWHDTTTPDDSMVSQELWLEAIASSYNCTIEQLDYIFCTDNFLLQINKDFLNHDYFTDVISFPYHQEGENIRGEIYISMDRIKENAIGLGIEFAAELHRVMVHGLLHFLGFHDGSEQQKEEMTSAEDRALHLLTK